MERESPREKRAICVDRCFKLDLSLEEDIPASPQWAGDD
jgi:hypothetical protein